MYPPPSPCRLPAPVPRPGPSRLLRPAGRCAGGVTRARYCRMPCLVPPLYWMTSELPRGLARGLEGQRRGVAVTSRRRCAGMLLVRPPGCCRPRCSRPGCRGCRGRRQSSMENPSPVTTLLGRDARLTLVEHQDGEPAALGVAVASCPGTGRCPRTGRPEASIDLLARSWQASVDTPSPSVSIRMFVTVPWSLSPRYSAAAVLVSW